MPDAHKPVAVVIGVGGPPKGMGAGPSPMGGSDSDDGGDDMGALAGQSFASAVKSGNGANVWKAFQGLMREYNQRSGGDEKASSALDKGDSDY